MRTVIAFVSRHRLAVALGVVVLLRAALPYALRPVLESQASKAINANVTIGDVDLALHRAGIALEDVAVRPVTWTPETDTGEPPLISWKRFAVAVHWLPLFQKTVQLRELVLESPRVAVDRLQDGGLNVAALAPASEEEAAPAEKSAWKFGIDRIVLSDGGIRFRDLMFERHQPVELALGSFTVDDIALSPGVYGEPARLRLKGAVDEGRIALDAGFTPRDDGAFTVTARLKARRLPLHRTRVYVPKVGWSALEGEVGGVLEYTLETGGRNEVSGFTTVNGLVVQVPQLEGPGLAWKRLAVGFDPIDLAGHRAAVKLIDLSGMYLVARARGGVVLPFLEGLLTGKPVDVDDVAVRRDAPPALLAEPAPDRPVDVTQLELVARPPSPVPPLAAAPPVPSQVEPSSQPPPPVQTAAAAPAEPADAEPWQWSIKVLRIYESLLHVMSPEATVDAGVDLTIRRLQGDVGDAAPVKLAVVIEDVPLTLEGDLRVRPLGFAGTVKTTGLLLPNLLTTAGAFPPGVLQRARLDVDLGLAAGVLAPTAGDARVTGSVALLEPYLMGAGGPTMEVGATRIGLAVDELLVPGAVPEGEPPAVAADLRLTGGKLSTQDLWVVRTEPTPLDVRTKAFDLALDELTAPGAGPAPADGGTLRLRGGVTLGDLAVANAGGSGFDVALRAAGVTLGELLAPGIRAADRAAVTAPVRVAKPVLTLTDAVVTNRETRKRATGARAIRLAATDVVVPGALGGPRGDVEVRGARLAVSEPGLADQKLATVGVSARGIDVAAGTLKLPGPGSAAGAPIRARDTSVRLAELRANDTATGIAARVGKIDLDVGDLTGAPANMARGARLRVVDASAAGRDAREFLVAARAVDLDATEIAAASGAPGHATLRAVTVIAPRVQLLRTPDGIRLPGPAAPPAKPGAPPAPVPAAAPAAAPAQSSPPFGVTLATFRLSDGRVVVVDRSVKPTFTGGLTGLQVDASDVRWPERSAGRLHIETATTQAGKVVITGSLAPAGGKLDVVATEIPLKQFSPYASGASPYSIRRGRLTVTTKATFNQQAYDSDTSIKLADFDLGGRKGDSLFKEQFGIPISMALALLRDLNGDIKIDVPVEGDESGMRVGYRTIIAGALRQALMGAITSPLKLVGSVFSGGKPQPPEPIGFRLGRAELTDDGAKQVGQVAKFLADRPAMGVALETAPTPADARWLHEHQVVEELGAPPGVFGRVRNLVQRGRRDRIRQALDERAEGKPGELGPDDQKALDEWLAKKPKATPEQLHALAEARLTLVETALREKHGVAPGRIVRREIPAAAPEDTSEPVADIELGSVDDLTAPEEDEPALARGTETP